MATNSSSIRIFSGGVPGLCFKLTALSMLFFVIGEIIVRIDCAFTFFNDQHFIAMRDKAVEAKPFAELVQSGKLPIRADDLRVMVIGDSIINGGTLKREQRFSSQLKHMLETRYARDFHEIHMLDVSCYGNNTLKNRLAYFDYAEKFRPHLVILGYNYNDNYGPQEEAFARGIIPATVPPAPEEGGPGEVPQETLKATRIKPLATRISALLYKSEMLRFLLHKIHIEFKVVGIVLPGSGFHHEIHQSHSPEFAGWKKGRLLLEEMISNCHANECLFLAYVVPRIDVLINPANVQELEHNVKCFFESKNTLFLSGLAGFKGLLPMKYAISRYDDHLNELGHEQMARNVYDTISPWIAGRLPARAE